MPQNDRHKEREIPIEFDFYNTLESLPVDNRCTKIDDIANQCGFKYGSYFNRQFTKYLGISPSEFRKNPTGYSVKESRGKP